MAQYEFWNFWIYIIIDGIILLGMLGLYLWNNFFDTRLRVHIIYPNKQIKLFRCKIENEIVKIFDDNSQSYKTYTINKEFIYYRFGRIPHAFFWDNIPIPLNLSQKLNFKPDEKRLLEKINKKFPIQINVSEPSKNLKKNIELDTAETFFRVLHTNLTLNLLKPPFENKKIVKWTMILIIGAVIIAFILHFTGVINLFDILGTKPPK